jgi:hypothetical protein
MADKATASEGHTKKQQWVEPTIISESLAMEWFEEDKLTAQSRSEAFSVHRKCQFHRPGGQSRPSKGAAPMIDYAEYLSDYGPEVTSAQMKMLRNLLGILAQDNLSIRRASRLRDGVHGE